MTTLKLGSRGNEVKTLQSKLNLIADGIFGPITEEVVKDFQKKNGLTADGVVGPSTWDKLGVTNSRYINEIIVHCSATAEGKDFTVADIKKWHLARGFSDIGYHYVIYRDGSINKGRSYFNYFKAIVKPLEHVEHISFLKSSTQLLYLSA